MKTLDPVLHRSRKEAILQQARHLFATKGFAETSMDDIAQNHHIQKASLYHYFKSKQAILEDMIHMEGERWAQLHDDLSGADFAEALRRFSATFFKYIDEPAGREFFKIIHFESHKNPTIFKAFQESPMCKRGALMNLFEKHLGRRLSSTTIAMLATQFMGGLIHYVTLSRMRGENMCMENFSDSAYAQQLVEIFIRGMEKL